jgi:AGZA family xanthine/uracil permease-like MFS transporter
VVGVIERQWLVAAAWCAAAALLSAAGLMHSYQWTSGDTALKLAPAWPFAIGYTAMALLFVTAKWTTEESHEHG